MDLTVNLIKKIGAFLHVFLVGGGLLSALLFGAATVIWQAGLSLCVPVR